jgi:hypothetical protein
VDGADLAGDRLGSVGVASSDGQLCASRGQAESSCLFDSGVASVMRAVVPFIGGSLVDVMVGFLGGRSGSVKVTGCWTWVLKPGQARAVRSC